MPTCPKCKKILSTDQALAYHMQSSGCKLSTSIIDELHPKFEFECHTNLKGEMIFASQSFCQLLGFTKEELLGTNASLYIFPGDAKMVHEWHVESLLNKSEYNGCLRFVTKIQGLVWINVVFRQVEDQGTAKLQIRGNVLKMPEEKSYFICDKKFMILDSNSVFNKKYCIAANFLDLIHQDDMKKLFELQTPQVLNIRIMNRDNKHYSAIELDVQIKSNFYFFSECLA